MDFEFSTSSLMTIGKFFSEVDYEDLKTEGTVRILGVE